MLYVYLSYIKNILYFISILHVILKKSGWSFYFLQFFFFFFFLVFIDEWKYKKTWFLYVTSNTGFLEFSIAKTFNQNKEYMLILWYSWIVICLSWRPEIVIRNPIATMLFPCLMTIFSSTVVPRLVSWSTEMMYAFLTRFMVCMMYSF